MSPSASLKIWARSRRVARYRRLAAGRRTALRHRQRSAADKQRDYRKTFHGSHFHLQLLEQLSPDVPIRTPP
jgi:hypothetical protein